jgi:hypothetical protein
MTQINPEYYDSDPFNMITMKKSKFGPFKDNRSFSVKAKDFGQSLLFWKGRKKGMVYTRDLEWDDIRYIFFPKNFSEKYGYLGSVPDYKYYDQAMVPLVLAMDYEAKPWWCPRWFLRFLQVFGNDKSIVRVRNQRLHNLQNRLTKGITFYDYKTKWSWYDLRISVAAPKYIQDLADAIEDYYYRKGYKEDITKKIKEIEPDFDKWMSNKDLEKYYEDLIEKSVTNKTKRINNEEGD